MWIIPSVVEKGQPLLALYSPELVAAQEEYLTALDYAERMRDGAVREYRKVPMICSLLRGKGCCTGIFRWGRLRSWKRCDSWANNAHSGAPVGHVTQKDVLEVHTSDRSTPVSHCGSVGGVDLCRCV